MQCDSSIFFEVFQEIWTEGSVKNTIFRKVLVLQDGYVWTSIFLLVFRTPFYGCSQKLNKNAFLWMITLFYAKTPVSSKICQIMVAYFHLMSLHAPLFFLRTNFTHFWKNIPHKKLHKTESLLCKDTSSQKFHKCYSWRNLQWSSYHFNSQPLR